MPPTGATADATSGASMRVLIVEDEVHLAEALRDGLTAEGFAVDLAFDGERGLHLGRENPYDAIVLDLMIPRLSGYEVCRTLRREQVWTPVLILTAKDGEYDQADALDLGADGYLTKPFSFLVLVATLRALLRRGAPERPAVLNCGLLELDPADHRVGPRTSGDPDDDVSAHLPSQILARDERSHSLVVQHRAGHRVDDVERLYASLSIPVDRIKRELMAESVGQIHVDGHARVIGVISRSDPIRA